MYKSQIKQDIWVEKKWLEKNSNSDYFVEIGAYDGINLSNSYLFEEKYKWPGICVECNPIMINRFRQNRPNSILCTKAIYKESGHKLRFNLNDCNSCIDENGDYEVETISLNDLLVQYNAPKDITYISLDIEGLESEVLSTFNFEQWNVKCWTIEHNFLEPNRTDIINILLKHNYCVKMHEWDIFAFKDWLEPEYYKCGIRVK